MIKILDDEVFKAQETLVVSKKNARVFRNKKLLETIKSIVSDEHEQLRKFEESLDNDELGHCLKIAIDYDVVRVELSRKNVNNLSINIKDLCYSFPRE